MTYIGATSKNTKGQYIPMIIDTVTHQQWQATNDLCRSFQEAQTIANLEAKKVQELHDNIPY